MNRLAYDLVHEYLDDLVLPEASELGLRFDLAREELDDDELGLRSLYEHPEALLGNSRAA